MGEENSLTGDYFLLAALICYVSRRATYIYKGRNTLGAGYLLATLPIGKFNINAGVRYEFNQMELITNSRDDVESPQSKFYRNSDSPLDQL